MEHKCVKETDSCGRKKERASRDEDDNSVHSAWVRGGQSWSVNILYALATVGRRKC
jgi:hypothetical protein